MSQALGCTPTLPLQQKQQHSQQSEGAVAHNCMDMSSRSSSRQLGMHPHSCRRLVLAGGRSRLRKDMRVWSVEAVVVVLELSPLRAAVWACSLDRTFLLNVQDEVKI